MSLIVPSKRAQNLQQLGKLHWITRVPRSLKAAQFLADFLSEEVFSDSQTRFPLVSAMYLLAVQ